MTKQTISFALATASEIYQKQLSDPALNVYYEIFKEFEDKIFLKALKESVMSSKFFPTPADIIYQIDPNYVEKQKWAEWVKEKEIEEDKNNDNKRIQ